MCIVKQNISFLNLIFFDLLVLLIPPEVKCQKGGLPFGSPINLPITHASLDINAVFTHSDHALLHFVTILWP